VATIFWLPHITLRRTEKDGDFCSTTTWTTSSADNLSFADTFGFVEYSKSLRTSMEMLKEIISEDSLEYLSYFIPGQKREVHMYTVFGAKREFDGTVKVNHIPPCPLKH
jgi:hypothetical protein